MAEILLVRHAKALANKRDFTVFGNEESPLDPEKGVKQATELKTTFRYLFGIDPETYEQSVLSSTYVRPQQTAELAGFKYIETDKIINESVFGREDLSPKEAVTKHAREKWVPSETAERAARFIELVRAGDLTHHIYFSHGLFIAGVTLQLANEAEAAGTPFPHEFRDKRGYIPDLAIIVPVTI